MSMAGPLEGQACPELSSIVSWGFSYLHGALTMAGPSPRGWTRVSRLGLCVLNSPVCQERCQSHDVHFTLTRTV